ncbi:hypothetical protein [Delftia lacustris]|uniref:hypothetical protein n=1 Tax=Delftia lacustris TaxID=558537 RepID=UPI002D78A1B5|nr:hypothetical protein [Delftia lacustris]
MGRTATKAAQPVQDVVLDQGAVARIEQAQDSNALALLETSANAKAMAAQMGYEGPLTVGALEDEIRFYQRRTVEAILETGKRLLVLRELTGHGNSSQIGTNQDFSERVELLGFSRSTAYRFMQAAAKTANSANLTALSNQIKSASAFLELVTHDDDALESLKDMDDIDRMSASQLRSTLRQAKADNKYAAEQQDKERIRAEKAEKALKAGGPQLVSISERLKEFSQSVDDTQEPTCAGLISLKKQAEELAKWWLNEVTQQPGYVPGEAKPMPPEAVALAQKIHDNVERIASMVGGLQYLIWETYGHEIQAARTYVMQPGAIAGQPLAQAE